MMNNYRNYLKAIALFFLVFIQGVDVFAGITNNSNRIYSNSIISAFINNVNARLAINVSDLTYNDETQIPWAYGVKRTGIVSLKYERRDFTDIPGNNWEFTVNYRIHYANYSTNESLTIKFSNSSGDKVEDTKTTLINTGNVVNIQILGIVAKNINTNTTYNQSNASAISNFIPNDISIELAVVTEKYKELQEEYERGYYNGVLKITKMGRTYNPSNRKLTVFWDYIQGAESYDLEWVFIDEKDINSASLNTIPGVPQPYYSPFEYKKPIRVNTSNQHYEIDNTYSKGRLYFRMRAVGKCVNYAQGNYSFNDWGLWQNYFDNSNTPIYFDIIDEFETNKNWQSSNSYAEAGLKQTTISFADGTSRLRQNLVVDNDNNTILVAEKKYDYEGRPVVSILPFPVLNNGLNYKDGLHLVNNGSNIVKFGREHFDDINTANPSSNLLSSGNSGSSNYYSASNTINASRNYIQNAGFIPDAEGYPYMQTRYERSLSSRVTSQSGIGADHQVFSKKDTRYLYGNANQTLLHKLFGSNVGISSNYKKTTVIDANGQASNIYTDKFGKTIITSISTNSPLNLIEVENFAPQEITTSILDNNFLNVSSNSYISEYEIINESEIPKAYNFSYGLNNVFNNTQNEFCFDCEYRLEIYIINPDGSNTNLDVINYTTTNNCNFTYSNDDLDNNNVLRLNLLPSSCNSNPVSWPDVEFSASFDIIGTYKVMKKLTILPPALDDATKTCIANENSLDYNEILAEEISILQTELNMCDIPDSEEELIAFASRTAKAGCDVSRDQMLSQISPDGYYYELLADGSNQYWVNWFWNKVKVAFYQGNNTQPGNLPSINPQGITLPKFEDLLDPQKFLPKYAEAFLYLHPEYCLLSKCYAAAEPITFNTSCSVASDYNRTVPFDYYVIKMENIESWLEAVNTGYAFPIPCTSSWLSGTGLSCPTNQDPNTLDNFRAIDCLYSTPGQGQCVSHYYNTLLFTMEEYYQHSTGTLSIWQYINENLTTIPGAGVHLYPPHVLNNSILLDKWKWELFVNLYNTARENAYHGSLYLSQQTCGCLGHDNGLTDKAYLTDANGAPLQQAIFADLYSYTYNIANDGYDDLLNNYSGDGSIASWLQYLNEDYDSDFAEEDIDYWKEIIFNNILEACSLQQLSSNQQQTIIEKLDLYLAGSNLESAYYETIITNEYITTPGNPLYDLEGYLVSTFGTCASLIPAIECDAKVEEWLIKIGNNCPPLNDLQNATIKSNLNTALETYCNTYSNILSEDVFTFNPVDVANGHIEDIDAIVVDDLGCSSVIQYEFYGNDVNDMMTTCFLSVIEHFNQNGWNSNLTLFNTNTTNHTYADCFDNFCSNANSSSINIHGEILCNTSPDCYYFRFYDECGNEIDHRDIEKVNHLYFLPYTGISVTGLTFKNVAADITLSTAITCNGLSTNRVLAYVYGNCDGLNLLLPTPIQVAPSVAEYCQTILNAIAQTNAQNKYNELLENYITEYLNQHQAQCKGVQEKFICTYTSTEQQFTLYYYDQAGNLVQTVPPEGIDMLGNNAFDANGKYLGILQPQHRLKTNYAYNSFEQLNMQLSPDGGTTNYFYNNKNQLRASQNAKQAIENRYSYTNYDNLGRIKEVGEIEYNSAINNDYLNNRNLYINGFPVHVSQAMLHDVTQTTYDNTYLSLYEQYVFGSHGNIDGCIQDNTRNRISATASYSFVGGTTNNGVAAFYGAGFINGPLGAANAYSYDKHGNVSQSWQKLGYSGITVNYKYHFDLFSGNMNQVVFQENKPDQFIHKFTYDSNNRLKKVHTSKDKLLWEEDARYYYYLHGPLARVELGQDNLQGLDYYYTIHGWIKGANTPGTNWFANSNATVNTMGQDGFQATNNLNRYFGRDEMAYNLAYYDGDYTPIASTAPLGAAAGNLLWPGMGNSILPSTANTTKGLYNGNIAAMITDIPQLERNNTNPSLNAYAFQYDQLNRLISGTKYNFDRGTATFSTSHTLSAAGAYNTEYAYDANGNISNLKRNGSNGTQIDNLSYTYNLNAGNKTNNQLLHVADAQGAPTQNDIGNYTGGNRYAYDAIGNLKKDLGENISDIKWNAYGKVREVIGTGTKPNIEFHYDGMGNRVLKIVKPKDTNGQLLLPIDWQIDYYTYDAQGNAMALYEGDGGIPFNYTLAEQYLYGSARLGTIMRNKTITTNPSNYFADWKQRTLGSKRYELSNHLGNVLAAVKDHRTGIDDNADDKADYYTASVASATDYYPGGMAMAGRSYNADGYRFGYGGNEQYQEINGAGNALDFGSRIYDSRVNVWMSTDPKKAFFPHYSPYHYAGNNPIMMGDNGGEQNTVYIYINEADFPMLKSYNDKQKLLSKLYAMWAKILSANKQLIAILDFKITNEIIPRSELDGSDAMVVLANPSFLNKKYPNNDQYPNRVSGHPADIGYMPQGVTTDGDANSIDPAAVFPQSFIIRKENSFLGTPDIYYPNLLDMVSYVIEHELGHYYSNILGINDQNDDDHDRGTFDVFHGTEFGIMHHADKNFVFHLMNICLEDANDKYYEIEKHRVDGLNKGLTEELPLGGRMSTIPKDNQTIKNKYKLTELNRQGNAGNHRIMFLINKTRINNKANKSKLPCPDFK